MSRSLKKGPFVDQKLIEKISRLRVGDKTIVKTWARDSSITPQMVGFVIGVHNGKNHITVIVTEDMVGHKLGEFAPTRKFIRHGGKMQRDIESKVAEVGAEATKTAVASAPVAKGNKK